MAKQLLLPLAAVALFIILVGLFIQKSPALSIVLQKKTIIVGSKSIQVEIANTETLREKGLGGRKTLAADTGMLFIFDTKTTTPTFWMKGMLIPLDMIWIADGKIVKIDKNIPAPSANTPDNKLSRFTANQPINYVLEVNTGFADANKLKVGDSVTPPTL
jgi:uncharacterized membrane protein (UPF0127 family)